MINELILVSVLVAIPAACYMAGFANKRIWDKLPHNKTNKAILIFGGLLYIWGIFVSIVYFIRIFL